jgi:hypothetical protein
VLEPDDGKLSRPVLRGPALSNGGWLLGDVHKESISICVRNSVGKVVMESVIETKASTILQFIDGLRGDLRVTFEEGTWAAWLYDLLKPRVSKMAARVTGSMPTSCPNSCT